MQSVTGNTALIRTCRRGHVETAVVLLNNGAIVDQQNKVKESLNNTRASLVHGLPDLFNLVMHGWE